MKDRVKFYGRSDLLYGCNMERLFDINYPVTEDIGINDVIEFYEMERYFLDGAKFKNKTNQENREYRAKSSKLVQLTYKYFDSLSDKNIVDEYEKLERGYLKVFWMLFEAKDLYKRISLNVFSDLLNNERTNIENILRNEQTTKKYGQILRDKIFNDIRLIQIPLLWYDQKHNNELDKNTHLYKPKQFTKRDFAAYIEKYVESADANPNILREIVIIRNDKEFMITDKVRLAAKRRDEEETKKFFENTEGNSIETKIIFSKAQDVEVATEFDGARAITCSYSTKWLEETLDFPSILNNFIYIFFFVDNQMRMTHTSKETEEGVFENAMTKHGSNIYSFNFAARINDNIANMQMLGYYDFLKKHDINLEDALTFFFCEYLQKEFDCSPMRIVFPSTSAKYSEKCQTIIGTMEAVLNQFSLYVETRNIDFELLQMSSHHKKFDKIPSQIPKKYVYVGSEEIKRLFYFLFSDQCTYTYVERIYKNGKKYSCLFELLSNEKIYLSDYEKYNEAIQTMRHLEEWNIVDIDGDGLIKLGDKDRLIILRDLYENEVISRWFYPSDTRKIIDNWVEEDYLVYESTLLSRSESKYFNFFLNKAEFDNGHDLRNKYAHGMGQLILDENEHKNNYLLLLRFMVILAIKINDDFWLKDYIESIHKKNESEES